MKKHLFVGLITTISLFSLVAMAQAALIQYTSFATWNAAVGPATGTENFNSFLVDAEFRTTTVAANNMTIAGEPGSNGSLTNKIDAPPLEGSYNIDNTAFLFADLTNPEQLRIDFTTGVTAWGASFNGISDFTAERNTSIYVYDVVNNLLGTVSTSSSSTNELGWYGFGLTSGVADYIIFQNSFSDSNDVFGIDDVVFKTVVPEPATMLLLGTGLVGIAGAARRRKKNQA